MEEAVAYISFEQAPSVSAARKIAAPRLAWGRIAMVGCSLAFWVGLAFAIRSIL
ncbi:hypothetical protein ACN2C7_02880 [Caulobacter sp. ErkDOM-E]|uniref:hypothetical protein n=1 Tax=Caulobacter sp. ErkDOM-E TaxID=3402778 RepID=UPI003AF71DE7